MMVVIESLRALLEGHYDLQKVRIANGNRILANVYSKLGLKPGEKKEKLEAKDSKILDQIVKDYRRITDGIVFRRNQIRAALADRGTELISNEVELSLAHTYVNYLFLEAMQKKEIDIQLELVPIWNEFMKGISGVGTLMASAIITRLDPHKANYPSSFWKYCGLDVGPDGRGRGKFREHLEERTYTDKKGEEKVKIGLTYNPWLKSKLVEVLAGNFIKKRTEKYYDLYVDYKHRMKNHPVYHDRQPMAIERMAKRYMMKIFLLDLWKKWRELEGLPIHEPYHVAKLGLRDHAA